MKTNVWDFLSILTLLFTGGIILIVTVIFINPYTSINPFKPPTPVPTMFLPSQTPTLRQLPPTWTPGIGGNQDDGSLKSSSTPVPSGTSVSLPTPTITPTFTSTPTDTPTVTNTPTITNTPTKTLVPTKTKTPEPTVNKTATELAKFATDIAATKQIQTDVAAALTQTEVQKTADCQATVDAGGSCP
ncbi:MAG: hypothetical protein JEZ06_01720 [Anaerolineaceae bacterium]|nr:hypothetical protein [Anaerolineaceae bacterium]